MANLATQGTDRKGVRATSASHETCPYRSVDVDAFWDGAVASPAAADVDPIRNVPFKIAREDRIATAGSCFAQHIARRLKAAGYNYTVVEPGYERMSERLATKYNYGTFSARYGNIYTPRQLLQLFDRAYGTLVPSEPLWRNGDHWVDPFRPMIQPNGFATRREAELDREQHLLMVQGLMETLDVLVFTLGLTEAWICKSDGAVLPVCPGCGAGAFDADRYEFRNFEYQDVVADMSRFIEKLRQVNSAARVVLTVSPVPLVATYTGDHVLTATTYSKSVLRAAAEQVVRAHPDCAYFPSYEIITGAFSRGRYFADDLRRVQEDGIDHVMRLFFRHYGDGEVPALPANHPNAARDAGAIPLSPEPSLLDAICEEYASLHVAGDR